MKCIKLTDHNRQTYLGTLWTPGKWQTAEAGPVELCSLTALHAYPTLDVARLCWPLHVNWPKIRAWEAEYEGEAVTDGAKIGAKWMRVLQEVPWVPLTTEQCVQWAIVCAWGGAAPLWREWALRWLRGEDRSRLSGESLWTTWATWAASGAASWSAAVGVGARTSPGTAAASARAAVAAVDATETTNLSELIQIVSTETCIETADRLERNL